MRFKSFWGFWVLMKSVGFGPGKVGIFLKAFWGFQNKFLKKPHFYLRQNPKSDMQVLVSVGFWALVLVHIGL